MLAYKYDKTTKEYLRTQEAQPDPLNGGYLLPADCTFTAPPTVQTEQVAVYEINVWTIKTDKRNTWQVKLSDVTFSKVDYIGDVRTGYQFISDTVYNNYQADNDRYKVKDGVFTDIIDTAEYREIKRQKEAQRVANLQCTKRVFILMLEELQLNYYEQILPVIEANRSAKLEWELCVQLQRSNPLIDQIALQFGITSTQLDNIFKYANGEITLAQFRGAE